MRSRVCTRFRRNARGIHESERMRPSTPAYRVRLSLARLEAVVGRKKTTLPMQRQNAVSRGSPIRSRAFVIPHRVIAIDGPAASGKSSVALELARRLGFAYVNSGAMYLGCHLARVRKWR